jgi:hypothetical protein
LGFVIVWRARHDWWRALAAAIIGAVIPIVTVFLAALILGFVVGFYDTGR